MSEEKACKVHTGDEQHEADDDGKQPGGGANKPIERREKDDALGRYRDELAVGVPVVGVHFRQARGNGVHRDLNLGDGYTGCEPRLDEHGVIAPRLELIIGGCEELVEHHHRRVDRWFHSAEAAHELRRCDAEDRVGASAQTHFAADDGWVPAERGVPILVGQHDDGMGAWIDVVPRQDRSAHQRFNSKQREVVSGDHLARDHLDGTIPIDLREVDPSRADAFEHVSRSVSNVLVVRVREDVVMKVRCVDVEINELFGCLEGGLFQQHGIDEGEDGSVGANSDCQRQDRDRCETGALPQPPGCIGEVSPNRGQERITVAIPAFRTLPWHAQPPIVWRPESNPERHCCKRLRLEKSSPNGWHLGSRY